MTNLKRTFAVTVAAVAFVLTSSAASALPSVSILWRDNGTPTIGTPAVNSSSIITADIVLSGDSTGVAVTGVFISLAFDITELQAVSGGEFDSVNLPGMGNSFSPLSPGVVIDNIGGLITNFDQATLSTGLNSAINVTLGSIRFHVSNPSGDSSDVDVIAGLFNAGVDTISTSAGPGDANFNGASVTGPVVPEPTTALLVIAGLAGLGYAGRRSIR